MSNLPVAVCRAATLSFVLACGSVAIAQSVPALAPAVAAAPATAKHNVIIFVADGLRRNSVNATDTPALYRLRTEGVDLSNSHSVFPSVTTANASAIATGHGLGDTGDYGNVIYTGRFLTDRYAPRKTDSVTPFLEDDDVLANMNLQFNGNYLGETTLLTAAHQAGFNVAAVGKIGPTAIQLISSVSRDPQGNLVTPDVLIVDDSTGYLDNTSVFPRDSSGIPLPLDFYNLLIDKKLLPIAPSRSNGYGPRATAGDNGYSGNANHAGTLIANNAQEQWFADVTTQAILPSFADDITTNAKPFVLLFWSRDPDGTQHNQGDSLQTLTPGINGPTSALALRNADHCLGQMLDWLDKHPDIKANTDVIVTSDHGFATISRSEIDSAGHTSTAPSASRSYKAFGSDTDENPGILPTGFLAVDLALGHDRLFDASLRSTIGDSPYTEVLLDEGVVRNDRPSYPTHGVALIGPTVKSLDATDARIIVAPNGGSDFLYVLSRDPALVRNTVATLSELDYIDGIFVDDAICPKNTSCPGALPISAVGLKGASRIPEPTIAVTFKHFFLPPDEKHLDPMQYGIQVADGTLQEGQGNHGALARDQTWNNMAAIGPDFKRGYIDTDPVGNMDITPTVAAILGLDMPSIGKLKGRVMSEALAHSSTTPKAENSTLVSAPAANGRRTVLHYQQSDGVHYYDRACMIASEKDKPVCPE